MGDLVLHGVTALAAAVAAVLVGLIAIELVTEAWQSIERFGIDFLTGETWDPGREVYNAGAFIFGTAVTSLLALAIAGPLSIAIALYVTELSPRFLRGPVTALVETLAAVPSVVLGLWGILVLGPFVKDWIGPVLNGVFGWIPIFSGDPTAAGSMLAAILILTIMITPIVSSITRELFLGVPRELKEGALALGTTRWEMVRGVVLPYARAGIAAAFILGLGRALGEAIAVTQVIGNRSEINSSVFESGDTLASRIAAQYVGVGSDLGRSSLVYLAVILLVFSLLANLLAQFIVRRFAGRNIATTR